MKKLITAFTISVCFLFITLNANAQVAVISGGNGLLANYTSLTNIDGLFADLNATDQSGESIFIQITANSLAETGTVPLTGASGMWTSLSITPAGDRIISGTPASGIPLIDLNGADLVTVDGIGLVGNALTISNLSTSSTAGTSTIRIINGSVNNEVTNCTILGSSQTEIETEGGTVFFSTDATTTEGNDANIISNCNIGPAGNFLPVKAIFSLGSTSVNSIRNSFNMITNNNIYDFFGGGGSSTAGIYIANGNDSWTISFNKIFQTGSRVFTESFLRYSGIILNTEILPGSFTVNNNKIGFANSSGTGVTAISGLRNEIRGIDAVSTSNTIASEIGGNIISGITQTSSRFSTLEVLSAFSGISMGSGAAGNGLNNATGNTIGSIDGSSSIVLTLSSTSINTAPVIAILNFSSFSTIIAGNNIGNITITGTGIRTGFRGILVNTPISNMTSEIRDNTISDITDTQVGTYSVNGIVNYRANATMVNNVIRNMTGNANATGAVVMAGIQCFLTAGVSSIEKNKIYNLKNIGSSVSLSVFGIDVSFPATANEIKQNYIYGLSVTSSNFASQIWGIVKRSGGNGTVYNNMISLGLNTDGTSITGGYNILGIYDGASTAGSFNYYYNSVYIGGTGVAAAFSSNSYAMFSNVVPNQRNFINNIFWNARSNSVAGGSSHYAIKLEGTGINPAGLTSNYNNLFVSGTGGVTGFYDVTNQSTLAYWKLATGQDANSSSVTVDFVDPANGNLDLDVLSIGNVNLLGIPIPGIEVDIHKNFRDPEYPYIGADEGDVLLPVELASFTASVIRTDVKLNWTTASETNNSGFDVERTSALTSGTWSKVGTVTGNGTSATPNSYFYFDRNLASGNYSYRLKQIDFNGNFEYFNLSNEVVIGIPEKFELSQNYPNPFNPSTKINYALPTDGLVIIKIFDMSGKEVMSLVNEVKTAGYYSVNFNASNLSSGIYFYRLSAAEFTATKKMMLVK